MAKQNLWYKISIRCAFLLVTFISLASANNGNETKIEIKNVTSVSDSSSSESKSVSSTALPPTTTTTIGTTLSPQLAAAAAFLASLQRVETELPQSIPDFIRRMMKRYGEVKATEALASLDNLPLGLVMKIMLVEMDNELAANIVSMQRYAQTSDKALITMIGRLVAGDKNVPKDLFELDMKLMKFPWWLRIRARIFQNLEQFVSAYTQTSRTVVTEAPNKEAKRFEATVEELKNEYAAAVATESSKVAVYPNSDAANIPNLSLLNPLLQQALSLANTQPQTQQATNTNPFLFFGR